MVKNELVIFQKYAYIYFFSPLWFFAECQLASGFVVWVVECPALTLVGRWWLQPPVSVPLVLECQSALSVFAESAVLVKPPKNILHYNLNFENTLVVHFFFLI